MGFLFPILAKQKFRATGGFSRGSPSGFADGDTHVFIVKLHGNLGENSEKIAGKKTVN